MNFQLKVKVKSFKKVSVTEPTKLAFSTPDTEQSHHCCAPGLHKPEQSCTAPTPLQQSFP